MNELDRLRVRMNIILLITKIRTRLN